LWSTGVVDQEVTDEVKDAVTNKSGDYWPMVPLEAENGKQHENACNDDRLTQRSIRGIALSIELLSISTPPRGKDRRAGGGSRRHMPYLPERQDRPNVFHACRIWWHELLP
jgi:hypothetical protein